MPKQPKKLIVVGSGAIGIEFAYFYNAMGTEVTVSSNTQDRIVPVEDEEISKALGAFNLKRAGINILDRCRSYPLLTPKVKGVTATVKTAKGEEKLKADVLCFQPSESKPTSKILGLRRCGHCG